MLPRISSLVAPHKLGCLLRDGAHADHTIAFHVEHRTHVKTANGSVRVERALGAVLAKDLRETCRVLGQVFERNRAVLDERDRLSVALHRHHDVEAGLADVPEGLLSRRFNDRHHRIREAQVAHEFAEARYATRLLVTIRAGEFHEQDRLGLAFHKLADDRCERGIGKRQVQHGAVDQLHGARPKLDDVLGRVHRVVESRKMCDTERLVLRQFREADVDLLEPGEGAFAADQQSREIEVLRRNAIEVVSRDVSRDLRVARRNLVALARMQRRRLVRDLANRGIVDCVHHAEATSNAGGKPCIDRAYAIDHVAVGERTRSARVVSRHAADRCLRRGRDVHWIPEAMLAQFPIERIEHLARLDDSAARRNVQLDHSVKVLAVVDDQGFANCLSTLRGPATARQDGHARLRGNLHRGDRRIGAARHDHAHWDHLVDGSVGGVAAAACGIEEDLPIDLAGQPPRQRKARALRVTREEHGSWRAVGHGGFYWSACQSD